MEENQKVEVLEEALEDTNVEEKPKEPKIKTSKKIKAEYTKQDTNSQDYLGLKDGLIIEIDNEVSVIMQHAQEIKHTSENVSNEVKNYTKELNEQLDTWSRENFLTNLINNIKAVGKENFGSSRNIEQSALRIDRAIKQLKKQE